MGFFQFVRKLDIPKEFSLEEIPIFSSLTPAEQRLVEKRARLVEYKKGDIVYEEGTPADAFYVVISGRFRLFARSQGNTPEQNLIFFYRGDHFGEASLLTGRTHSGTVDAKSDGIILRFEKEDFLKMIKDVPSVSLHLSRTLGHRLTMSQGGKGPRREVKISALYASRVSDQVLQLWLDFARTLHEVSRREVILVDFVQPNSLFLREEFEREIPFFDLERLEPAREADVKSRLVTHPSGFHYLNVGFETSGGMDEKKVATLLTFLTYRYDHLLLRLPKDVAHMTFQSLKQSDIIYVFSEPGIRELGECANLIEEFERGFGFSRSEIKVIIPEEEAASQETKFEEKENFLGNRIFSLLPDRGENPGRYKAALHFLAKELAGTLVGLALGSGAAYGLAHIGVIRVLEKENIPIDIVSGSSMGALVGALWAAGYDSEQLREIAERIDKKKGFFRIVGLRDFSPAHQGFFKGQQLYRFLAPYLGEKTFQDLRIPVRIVATNLFTAEEVVFRAGLVTDAIRASVSIPGIFRPFRQNGQYLIDGGVIDPLPVRVLTQMGVKKVIAVNVLPGPKDWAARYQVQQENHRKRKETLQKKDFMTRFFAKTGESIRQRYSGNIFNVIMNTIQFMEFEMAETWGKKADILLHPMVPEGHWAQFYYPEKFIQAGEEAAREQMPEIKRLLAE